MYICRFSGAHNHHYLVGFIKNVGDQYTKNEQSLDFIIDLLRINVPNLLGLPEKTNTGHHKAVEIQHDFSTYVLTYIHQNALKNGLLQSLNKILVSIIKKAYNFISTCTCFFYSPSYLSIKMSSSNFL